MTTLWRVPPPPGVSLLKQFRLRFPEREVSLGATHWRYSAAGSRGRGLLLLGPASSFGDSNYHLIELFRQSRRVVSPSYPVLGSVGAVADGLVRLLDHEKIDVADVFGDALGAGVAQVLARRHPDRIDRVALASFGRPSPRHALRAWLELSLMRLLPRSVHRALLRRRMRRLTSLLPELRRHEGDALIEDLLDRHTKELALSHLTLRADLFENGSDYGLDEPLDRHGRVLMLLADDDPDFTALDRQRLISAWPGAEVHAFVTGGAQLATTRRGEFDRALERFFGDATPRWVSGPRAPTRGSA